ncbi:MAG: hypothetical protein N3H30_01405 [Candidatus Micrarchaeota archaeon]|nr:hypothetical protein [Candidatus Micrarchaeota archaeon]
MGKVSLVKRKYDLSLVPVRNEATNVGLRKSIKEDIREGATHTEIALKLLNSEDAKVRINPKILTPDAVIAKFVSENPDLAKSHKDVLAESSRINYSLDKAPNHKAFAIWALVSSHLFYPEVSGRHFTKHQTFEHAEADLKGLYADLTKVLQGEDGPHIDTIAKFTDKMATETAAVRTMIDEEEQRVASLVQDARKVCGLLHASGYKAIVLKEGETIDPLVLNIAVNSDDERAFVIAKPSGKRLKVSLRAVKGRIGANLYRVLNEEEKIARRGEEMHDTWSGSQIAGGSPLDGTAISFDRLAVILSKHKC